ncbi:MAG: HlyD family efflux transporter periplasmic adaptor subunit [Pseudomonadales bacterium]|nr:HlyD family efflux transporter periplasmic adaptor subunit [Pseudomonadales bacterium]
MSIPFTRRRLLIIGVLLLGAVVAVYFFAPHIFGKSETALFASGTIEATEAQLGFQSPGRIAIVGPREGDAVKAGDELARLDAAEMQARRAQAVAQIEAAQAGLNELERGTRREELAQARAALSTANDRMQDARRDDERAAKLLEGGAIGTEARDKARLALDVAASQLEQARQQWRLLEAGPREERIAAQKAQVAQTEAAVRVIDAQLANMTIRAPFDGLITVRHREPGETVPAGAPVLTLMNPRDRWVRIYVPETRIGQVELGSHADILTDSFPDKRFAGEVRYIASVAEFTPKSVQTAEERVNLVYAVKVQVLDDNALELKPGVPADVQFARGEP